MHLKRISFFCLVWKNFHLKEILHIKENKSFYVNRRQYLLGQNKHTFFKQATGPLRSLNFVGVRRRSTHTAPSVTGSSSKYKSLRANLRQAPPPPQSSRQKRFIYRLLTLHDFLAGSRQVTRLEAESYVPDRLWYCPPNAAKPVIESKHMLGPGLADRHLLVGR